MPKNDLIGTPDSIRPTSSPGARRPKSISALERPLNLAPPSTRRMLNAGKASRFEQPLGHGRWRTVRGTDAPADQLDLAGLAADLNVVTSGGPSSARVLRERRTARPRPLTGWRGQHGGTG